ncbi:hypothetical protein AMTRI_Chr01g126710 [Amborella trichopoda]
MASSLRTHSLCFCHSLSLSSQKHPAFISCKAHGTHSLVPSLSTILFRRHNRKYPFAFSFSTITAFNECGRDYRFPTLVAFSSSGEVTETEELEGAQTLFWEMVVSKNVIFFLRKLRPPCDTLLRPSKIASALAVVESAIPMC